MTKRSELLRLLLADAEETRERFLDDMRDCCAYGDRDAGIIRAQSARETASTIRQARKWLLEMEADEKELTQVGPQIERAQKGECAFCGSPNTRYEGLEMDAGQVEQRASCSDCESSWWEIYTISNIVRDGCDCRQYKAKGGCEHV